MLATPIAVIRSFLSGLFGGMASSQIRSGDYAGAKWRADLALRLASNPFMRMCALAVCANTALLGKDVVESKRLVNEALDLYRTTPGLAQFTEAVQLARELEALKGKLP